MSSQILSKYVIKRKIESGADGTVYKARCKDNGEIVAVKIAKRKGEGFPIEIFNNLILRRSGIDCIARMFDYEVNSSEYIIVMECMPCDLYTYSTLKTLTEDESRNIVKQLVYTLLSMQYKAGLSHMDIKIENCLMNPNTNQVKLCDFSACANVETLVADSKGKGTVAYWAPEILSRRRFYPTRSNVWAIGILAYSILPGHDDVPWDKYKDGMINELTFSSSVSQEAKDFVMTCLEPDVRVRVPLKYLINMKWLKNTN